MSVGIYNIQYYIIFFYLLPIPRAGLSILWAPGKKCIYKYIYIYIYINIYNLNIFCFFIYIYMYRVKETHFNGSTI